MSECSVPRCYSPGRVQGLCSKHYERWRAHGDPMHGEIEQRPLRAEWLPRAACAGHPHPEWWFHEVNRSRSRNPLGAKHGVELMEAKRICRDCPVRLECLRDNWHLEYGVYGGLDPAERRRARRLMA